jgi:phospho-N-acetylmuramoyl-pentapeptide-transferase
MAPLHCHFEQLGMPETQITVRFLLVTVAGSMLGVALAALN